MHPRVAAEIVRAAGVGPDDLVFDLGAGLGALTAPLATTGARVVAVERPAGTVTPQGWRALVMR